MSSLNTKLFTCSLPFHQASLEHRSPTYAVCTSSGIVLPLHMSHVHEDGCQSSPKTYPGNPWQHKEKLRRLPSSTSFHSVHHVCTRAHCRTEVGRDAHGNHRVVQNNKHMEHAPHSLYQLPLTFDISPTPLCRRIASKITEIISVSMVAPVIAHARFEDADTFPTSFQVITAATLNTASCHPTSTFLSV